MNIAITGGIGVGKTFVCQKLSKRGIKVYDCDAAAKRLMAESAELRSALTHLVGDDLYRNGILQKAIMAKFLLADQRNNDAINNIVHPAVAADFASSGMEWLESAILFESHFNERVDFNHIVCVVAPVETRLERIMMRDAISREQALQWVERQMSAEEVASKSDFVIVNDGTHDLDKQIENVIHNIYNKV